MAEGSPTPSSLRRLQQHREVNGVVLLDGQAWDLHAMVWVATPATTAPRAYRRSRR